MHANPSRFGATIQERSLGEEARQFDQGQAMQLIMAALETALQERGRATDDARQDRALEIQSDLANREMTSAERQAALNRILQQRQSAAQRIALAKERMAPDPMRERINTAMALTRRALSGPNPFGVERNVEALVSGAGLGALGVRVGGPFLGHK